MRLSFHFRNIDAATVITALLIAYLIGCCLAVLAGLVVALGYSLEAISRVVSNHIHLITDKG